MDRLGELERAVMACLWDATTPLTARQVHEILHAERGSAYTTISTTLTRLTRKGLASQERAGRGYVYQAISGRDEMFDAMLSDALGITNRDPGVFSRFVQALSDTERRALREALEHTPENDEGDQAAL